MLNVKYVDVGCELTDEKYQNLYSLVSSERQNNANKYKKRQDAQNTLIGTVLAELMLSEVSGFLINKTVFAFGEKGKPYIPESQFEINISHTGFCVACAVSTKAVGIDIQTAFDDLKGISNRFFTQAENNYITSDGACSKTRFTKVWTMKESYIKMIGTGLSIPLNTFDVFEIQTKSDVYYHELCLKKDVFGHVCTVLPKIDKLEKIMIEDILEIK